MITKRIALLGILCVGLACAMTARADEGGVEEAGTSKLITLKLPANAHRSNSKEDLAKFEEALDKVAEANERHVGRYEVLIWPGRKGVQDQMASRLKQAGYKYNARPWFESEPGKVTPFGAVPLEKSAEKPELLGLYIEREGMLLLAWATCEPQAAGDKSAKPAAEKESAGAGTVPKELLGSWAWTTITGVVYEDRLTSRTSEPSGFFSKFTFTKDGHYKMFVYIRMQTYSLVTLSTTAEEGTVIFTDHSFTLKPAKGHYKGHTGSRIIDRDMTDSERKTATWLYEWRSEDGKKKLYIGKSKEGMSEFKADK